MATALKALETWPYRNDRVHLSPYNPAAFPEDFLVRLHAQTKEDGLLDLVFPGSPSKMTLADFVGYLNARQRGLVIATIKNLPEYTTAGYGWLNEIEGKGPRKASFGFCFFRQYHRTREIRELARFALAYWFNEIDIDVLYGATLMRNRSAIKFAEEMGFTPIGEAPRFFIKDGQMENAWLVTLQREDFTGLQY